MKISLCWLYAIEKYGYPPSVKDTYNALKDAAEMGFKYVEVEAFNIKKNNVHELFEERKKLKKYMDELGLIFINLPIMLPGLYSTDQKVRDENLGLFDIGVEMAKYLGAEVMQLDSFSPSIKFIGENPYEDDISYGKSYKMNIDNDYSWDKEWDILVKMFKICCDKLKKSGIKLVIEPRVWERVASTDAILRLMDHVNCPNFFAILETAHMNAQKELIPLSVEKMGKRIFGVHIADNDSTTNMHNKVGDGNIDWESTLRALKKHGFNGYMAIDIKPKDKRDIKKDYIESKQYIEKLSAKIGL
ncbi:MAG: sugar phosphate isomerase/epimerase [Actinobacteria bacterium]|nr:sugar phosphate isomerase/epimerase [Actinomycetota bacterium]